MKKDLKLAKVWSVWVDGFEMNSYILTYGEALKMKDDLLMEGEYEEDEIFIDTTYADTI